MTKLEKQVGRAYDAHQAGRLDDAEAQYRALLLKHPRQVDALYLLSSLLSPTHPDEALDLARRALAASAGRGGLGVSEAMLLDHGAACLARRGGDAAQEAELLAKARRLDPARFERLFLLAEAQRRAGHGAAAMASLRDYLFHCPDDINAQSNLGTLQLQLGNIEAAIATLEQVVAVQPRHVQALNNLGYAYSQLGKLEQAVVQYRATLEADPGFAEAWVNLAAVLQKLNRFEESIAAFDHALAIQPGNETAIVGLNSVYVQLVPRWHFVMMNDRRRNQVYDAAIRRAVERFTQTTGRPPLVLDIGAGSGLLSMMAARAGAEHVVACEMVQPMAEVASAIIARNGLAEQITLHHKKSTMLEVGRDLARPADLLVSEIFDVGLLGEYVLPVLAHARQNLLANNAAIIPGRATLWMMPIASKEIHDLFHADNDNACGFDLSPFNRFAKLDYCQLAISRYSFEPLAEPVAVLDFDFSADVPDRERCLSLPATRAGRLDAWVFWFALDFGDDSIFDTGPYQDNTCWAQAIQVEPVPRLIAAATEIKVVVKQAQSAVRFAFDNTHDKA